MKYCIRITLFAVLLLLCVNVHASTGADLLMECKAVEVLATTDRTKMTDEEQTKLYLEYSGPGLHCMGQLRGANYINNYYGDRLFGYRLWCMPPNTRVTMLNVVQAVVKYLEARPNSLDGSSAQDFIVWALTDAFPCPDNQNLLKLLETAQRFPGDMAL